MLFLVVLFLLKTGFSFKNPFSSAQNEQQGLIYSTAIVGDLINKDTDGDGVPDWEETLYGLDPTKRETTPGIPDSTAVAKMKATQGPSADTTIGANQGPENLTQTDKFSRELFSTVAALNQNGNVDQSTVNQIGDSLASQISNRSPRKIYALSDIKVINDDSVQAVKKYFDTLNNIHEKYPIKENIINIMQKFAGDGTNVDTNALLELDPIIGQMQNTLDGIVQTSVPASLAQAHLDAINAIERLFENLNDIKLYDSDAIVSLSGINQYQTNDILFQSAMQNLIDMVNKKLKN